jgi:hypothetical protein
MLAIEKETSGSDDIYRVKVESRPKVVQRSRLINRAERRCDTVLDVIDFLDSFLSLKSRPYTAARLSAHAAPGLIGRCPSLSLISESR